MKHLAILLILAAALTITAVALWNGPDAENRARPSPSEPIRGQTISFPAHPVVRVNVTPNSGRRISIAIDGPYSVRNFRGRKTLSRRKRLNSTAAAATARGIRIGASVFASTDLEIVPASSPAIWVGDHQYRGCLRLKRQRDGTLLAVNVVALEDYVASVVNGETPAKFPMESRKAQAIVARSYALFEVQHRRGADFDVYADTRSQAYPGFQYRTQSGRRLAGESSASRRIAQSTFGLVCTHRGRLFHTYYSAVCGGRTIHGLEVFSDAGRPFASVECRWCRAAKRYRWSETVDRATVAKAIEKHFKSRGQRFGRLRSIQRHPQNAVGNMPRFSVSDGRVRYELTGADLRRMLGASRLPSTRFAIHLGGSRVTFRGQGHGHGVGLCQWGACGLAKAGRNVGQILRHYYRDIQVVRFHTLNTHRAARTASGGERAGKR